MIYAGQPVDATDAQGVACSGAEHVADMACPTVVPVKGNAATLRTALVLLEKDAVHGGATSVASG